MIDDLNISEDEKTLVYTTLDSLLRADTDRLEELLAPLGDDMKVNILRMATTIIDNLKIESENSIIEAGDMVQMEYLAELLELQDKSIANALEQVMNMPGFHQDIPSPQQNIPH